MTTPVPAPQVFPDIEAVLVSWLAQQLLSVYMVQARTCTDTPENLATAIPLVAIQRTTGADMQGLIDRPVVDIDCFAATRQSSNALAQQVHILLHRYFTGTVTDGGVIGMVNTVKGPGWMAYQDLAVRRCNATYEIYVRPAPA